MQPSRNNQEPQAPCRGDGRSGAGASAPFRLALIPAVLFIVTVLAFTAAQFGDARAPVQQWLQRNVGWMLAVEVAASTLLCLLALACDRRRSVQAREHKTPDDP